MARLRLAEQKFHDTQEIDPPAKHQVLLLYVDCRMGLVGEPAVLLIGRFEGIDLFHSLFHCCYCPPEVLGTRKR